MAFRLFFHIKDHSRHFRPLIASVLSTEWFANYLNENPYAPPRPTLPSNEAIASASESQRRVDRTAIAILTLAGVSLVLDLILLAEDVFVRPHSRLPQFGVVEHSILALVHAVQFLGGLHLRRLSSYRLAYVGAIACCVPCFSPFGVVGIPFGVYAISLLQQHDIVVAFRPPVVVAATEVTEQ